MIKYLLQRKLNIRTGYLIAMVLTTILIIGGYFSYALFTVSNESKGTLNIVTGNLYALIESSDLDSDREIVVMPNETKVLSLDLVNVNGREAKLNLYYSATSTNIEIGYLKSGDEAPTQAGVVLGANGSTTERKTIKVRITNNDTENVTVSFGTTAGLATADLAFPSDKTVLNKLENNVIAAYTYNEGGTTELDATKCITGEETTCQKTTCYQDSTVGACPVGTIFKYMVNDATMRYFYVLHDDGDTMTLQDRENTVSSTAWYADSSDSTQGPLTVLPVLENTTSAWTNVNDQTYTMGTTTFVDNAFTQCVSENGSLVCSENAYTLEPRTVKARMATAQEIGKLGVSFQFLGNGVGPIWMHNYLSNSTTYTGTVDSGTDIGYWTMTAENSNGVWFVFGNSVLSVSQTPNPSVGARAVVVVNKEIKNDTENTN